jgi:tetratricopeptide (TPR) repeat protein
MFRDEGDAETADAIEVQLRSDPHRSLTGEQHRRLRHALARARNCDRLGAYSAAAEHYADALQIVEGALGAGHIEAFDRLSDVARCRLNDGQYEAARADYKRLLGLVQTMYGDEDSLAAIARERIETCEKAIRDGIGGLRLQACVHDMLRMTQQERAVETVEQADRMRGIARRLAARGKSAVAVRLHERAIAITLRLAGEDDAIGRDAILRHAIDLREAGDPARARTVLHGLIARHNLRPVCLDQQQQLRAALQELSSCLLAMGDGRSAQETEALAEGIQTRTRLEGDRLA